MKTKIFFILALLCTGFIACKKTDSPAAGGTTQQKILGKWKFQNVVVNDFYSGSSHVSNYPGDPGDYFDFRADGKVYLLAWGSYDTSTYKIINETQLTIDAAGDTSDIKVINSVALQLYQKDVFAPGDYSESTIYLSK